ncbi:hypothetical protein ACFFF5_07510 [Lederbergia wuyishanensis]|uniref:Asparagine N-glycosylation enzyme membrane subunit Stt3 n=1 Tax=Lederbergia wuyishanensis TaxID=1347903 RepID=A0ABU0D268_9BACI|nr:hypothetical protein [Lederbergia wuyishanensis]MCJ8007333.1 hypothetical protein [Lederbergia wuyishanensis]MDQ0342501.1 asparagine N-glycosylation enzyme membrane subunit Stt3 [Lederbergia wuyishanensis]
MAALITSSFGILIGSLFSIFYKIEYLIVGLAVGMVTVPAMIIIVVLCSALIESTSKRKHLGWTYLKHLACGIICAGLFSLTAPTLFFIVLIIAVIFVTFFFLIDNAFKHLVDKKTLGV